MKTPLGHKNEIQTLVEDVQKGIKTPKEYAKGIVMTESEGIANQVFVASELGMKTMDGSFNNLLLQDYNAGDIGKDIVSTMLENNQETAVVAETGDNALEFYGARGQKLRDLYQRAEALKAKLEILQKKLQEVENKLKPKK